MNTVALSNAQLDILERIAGTQDLFDAFLMLSEHRHLVDESLLLTLVFHSQRLCSEGNFSPAAALAEIGLGVSETATPRTRIDLFIAGGQALAQMAEFQHIAAQYYRYAAEEAERAGTVYMLPLAKAMLGHFLLEAGEPERSRELSREAVQGSLVAESEVPIEVLWKALHIFIWSTIEGRSSGAFKPIEQESEHLWEEILAFVPGHLVPEIGERFGINTAEDIATFWAMEKGRSGVLVHGIHGGHGKIMLPFLRGMGIPFSERNGKEPLPLRPAKRASTNVLTDRAINGFPHFAVFITFQALERRPEAVSTVVHEFTHFWTFLGPLGSYFSALSAELFLLNVCLEPIFGFDQASSPDSLPLRGLPDDTSLSLARRSSALHRFSHMRDKVRLVWEFWRPWAEGLSLFAEIDLDVTESGDLILPMTRFLADMDRSVPDSADIHEAALKKVTMVEALQNNARRTVSSARRLGLWLGSDTSGNEPYYFAGYALISALWNRWATQVRSFGNSVIFMKALLWLSHSTFDEFLPDFRLSLEQFFEVLSGEFERFFEVLFNVPHNRLAMLADAVADTEGHAWDPWDYLCIGSTKRVSRKRIQRKLNMLRQEVAANFWMNPDDWIKATNPVRNRVFSNLMSEGGLHLLSRSNCEIRLLADSQQLVCIARSIEGGDANIIIAPFDGAPFERLSAALSTTTSGEGQLLQFCLVRPHAEFGMAFDFPLAFRLGEIFEVFDLSRRDSDTHHKFGADEIERMRVFDDPGRFRAGDDLLRLLGGTGAIANALFPPAADGEPNGGVPEDVGVWTRAVDHLYLRRLLRGAPAEIERVRRDRLRAFMPPPGAARATLRDAIVYLIRHDLCANIGELSYAAHASPESIRASFEQLNIAASRVGQKLIVDEAGDVRFVGFCYPHITSREQG